MLRIRQLQAIDGQENQHDVSADPLVAVYERMVFHQTVTEPSDLLLERGIGASAVYSRVSAQRLAALLR